MGYYTYYTMEIRGKKKDALSAMKEMLAESLADDKFYPFERSLDEALRAEKEEKTNVLCQFESRSDGENAIYFLSPYEMEKWYDYDEDMVSIASKYPDLLFTLEGDGEEDDDFWRMYYKGDKRQYAPGTIVYDDFDESKLIPVKPKKPAV